MPDSISPQVQQFLSQHIASIAQLELLLLLHRDPGKWWTVDETAKELYTAVSMTQPLLESLRTAGIVVVESDAARHYQFAPKSEAIGQSVDELARLYRERPVAIINLIYSAPTAKLQNFADAFRIRKKEEG